MTLIQFKLWGDTLIRAPCPSTDGWLVGGMFIFCVTVKYYISNRIWSTIRWNWYGQLGVEHTNNVGDHPNEMGDFLEDTDLGSDLVTTQLVAGYYYNCVLSNEYKVKCWG